VSLSQVEKKPFCALELTIRNSETPALIAKKMKMNFYVAKDYIEVSLGNNPPLHLDNRSELTLSTVRLRFGNQCRRR